MEDKQKEIEQYKYTFDKPPENKAKEKSARWFMICNFNVLLPVFV